MYEIPGGDGAPVGRITRRSWRILPWPVFVLISPLKREPPDAANEYRTGRTYGFASPRQDQRAGLRAGGAAGAGPDVNMRVPRVGDSEHPRYLGTCCSDNLIAVDWITTTGRHGDG